MTSEANVNTDVIPTNLLIKQIVFMILDDQTSNPLYPIYLKEAKKRVGI